MRKQNRLTWPWKRLRKEGVIDEENNLQNDANLEAEEVEEADEGVKEQESAKKRKIVKKKRWEIMFPLWNGKLKKQALLLAVSEISRAKAWKNPISCDF